jgi:hypothetical protein
MARVRVGRFGWAAPAVAGVLGSVVFPAVPKVRRTTAIAAATMTAVMPEVHALASTVPAAWEIRPD